MDAIAARAPQDAFTELKNPQPPDTPRDQLDLLPADKSAPVLDIMLGNDGKLHYKSYGTAPIQEARLLDVASAASPTLGAALRGGQVRQVHFRVFKPNQYPDEPSLEPRTEFREVPRDYNDGGKPAIYADLAGSGYMDTEAAALSLSHEASHRLLDQDRSVPPSAEEMQVFTEACQVMQKSALEYVRQDSAELIRGLGRLESLAPREYAPVFRELGDSIRQASYDQLPHGHLAAGEAPACFLQDPWQAIASLVKAKNINGGDTSALIEASGVEKELGELTTDWNDTIKESAIYRALNESTYLSSQNDNGEWGHSQDNWRELTATTSNLMLNLPEEVGEHVGDLPDNLKQATLNVVAQDYKKLHELHKNDPEFLDLLDRQYNTFLAKAGASITPTR